MGVDDLEAIDRLRPADWQPYRTTFEHYLATSACRPFGLELEGRLVAMGTLISFGTSAWVAQLVTDPEQRGRGHGTRMLAHLLAEAERAGAATVSLVATAQGQPLYARAGFRVEADYGFFHRPGAPTAASHPRVAPLAEPHVADVAALDAEATGEARRAYWSSLLDGARAYVDRGLEGAYLPRFGEGVVLARTEAAGRALLACRLERSDRVVVDLENAAACRWLDEAGFIEVRRAKRMVKGPSLVRDAGLVWARAGGNLG